MIPTAVPGYPLSMKAVLVSLVVALLVVCVTGYIGRTAIETSVEARLAERVKTSGMLGDARFSELVVNFDHLTATVEGTVASEALREEFLAGLSGAMGAGRVAATITVQPPLPAQIRIVRDGSKVEVSGTVSDRSAFEGLLSSLSAQDGIDSVRDTLVVAERTLPFPRASAFAAAALALIESSPSSAFSLENGELTAEGVLPKPAAKEHLLSMMVPLYDGAYRFIDRLTVAAPAPASISLKFSQGGRYELTGLLPSDESRATLLAAFPDAGLISAEGLAVSDHVETPAWFSNLPNVLTKLTGEVPDLELYAAAQTLRLKGTVASLDQAKEIETFVSNLVPGLVHEFGLVVRNPDPGPIASKVPSLQITQNNGEVIVSGRVADLETKEQILHAVRVGYPEPLKVIDQVEISAELPAFTGLAAFSDLLGVLGKTQAWVSLRDQQLVLGGEVIDETARSEILRAVKLFAPETYTIADRLTLPGTRPRVEAEPVVNEPPKVENFDSFTIYYDSGAYGLRDSEMLTFVEIIEAARKSQAPILIDGFADRNGVETVNEFVSRMRTEMLKKYLVERGIDESRISSTIWHGSVEGAEKDQKNRRTEIKVGK